MMILALDLSTHTGWAAGPLGGRPSFGTHHLPKTGDDIGRMLVAYEDWLRAMVADVRPTHVFFEAPILSQRTMTARKLMGLASETERLCHRLGLPVREVNLMTVKKRFTGSGRAEKARMIEEARRRGWDVKDDNQADALAIWDFGCAVLGRRS